MKDVTLFLKTIWDELVSQTLIPSVESDQVFSLMQEAYQASNRHYHNLHHIKAMLHLVNEYQGLINSLAAIRYACFFHDVVYDTNSKQNEEESAVFAEKHLSTLKVSQKVINETCQLILLTKSHDIEQEAPIDERIFLDIDLAILGSTEEQYKTYAQAIRNEYSQFPDELYQAGRRRVLLHFLSQEQLFKTQVFQERFENQAKQNIQWELQQYEI